MKVPRFNILYRQMSKVLKNTLLLFFLSGFFSCDSQSQVNHTSKVPVQQPAAIQKKLMVGAENTVQYFPQLKSKKVAVVANATSMIAQTHVVDSLLSAGMNVIKVFAPEHGFRGKKDAGEKVDDEVDQHTGLPIISLYGKNKKPSAEQLAGVEVILFDIQDVGVRFYTYLSTLHYVMEAAAEQDIPVIVLDRPNPLGGTIDGPVMEEEHMSFVGLHPVPIMYGMTIGEYAQMINGQAWISSSCKLTVVPCKNYSRDMAYELPIKPSPNLPNAQAIALYPSLCLFEGTTVSVGRGTDYPFQLVGHPDYVQGDFQFTPEPNEGAKYPKLQGVECQGHDLRMLEITADKKGMQLSWLIDFYQNLPPGSPFFLKTNFFDKLAGTDDLMAQVMALKTEEEIKASWEIGLKEFKLVRSKYLIY